MKTLNLSFAAWEPDKPDFGGKASMRARNVLPAQTGYRAFADAVPTGEALPSKASGAFFIYDDEGVPYTIAGTENALYVRQYDEWELKSAEDLSAGNNGWAFARYGNIVCATNGVDRPLYAEIGSGGISDFTGIENAPHGRLAAVVGDFLVVGGLAAYENGMRWSGIDDPLTWPEPGSNDAVYAQADIQIFPEGRRMQAVISGMSTFDALIFCETAIYRAQYVGSPLIFQFSDVDKSRGTIAPRSVIHTNNMVYFLAEDGFYATDGSTVGNIGAERVNLWFRTNADDSRRHETQAVYDPVNGVIAWAFASVSCPDDQFDRMLIYSPALDRFSLVHHDFEFLHIDAGRGMTLEDLDEVAPLDDLPFSLDARKLKTGITFLACFGTDHTTYTFSGLPKAAMIETSEQGGNRAFIHGARALVDGTEASVSILYREFQKDLPQTRQCSAPSRLDGIAYTRLSTRYARARVSIPSSDWTHATGVELYYSQEGGK